MTLYTLPSPRLAIPLAREPDPYEQRIGLLADCWRIHATRHSSLKANEVAKHAILAACFTLKHRCNDLTVPLKLEATARHQAELERLCHRGTGFGTELQLYQAGLLLEMRCGDDVIGAIPRSHTPWIRSLLPYGADLRLASILGCDREEGSLEVVVMVTRTGRALQLVRRPVVSNGSVNKVAEPGATSQALPIRLWREKDGTPRTNIPNLYEDSIQGHEWGYAGSGPAELAFSILQQFVPKDDAWAMHGAFKDDVLDPMPWEGGEITRQSVRHWISREKERRICC